MENRLCALYRELETLLNLAPCEEDCTYELNEAYSDMANLKDSLFNAGFWQVSEMDKKEKLEIK